MPVTPLPDPADERLIRDELDRYACVFLERAGLDISDGEVDQVIPTDRLIRLVQDALREWERTNF